MIKDLETALGYRFGNVTLLQNALTHSSYANEHWHNSLKSNERLEFLGDSILGMVVAEHLYTSFRNQPEGELTRMRADLVCEASLARAAEKLQLGKYLLLGHGETQAGGRGRASILADAMESVIAACYLDGGMAAARELIHRLIIADATGSARNKDYKTALQEKVQQQKNQVISYRLLSQEGPDHHKLFTVEVLLNGVAVGTGTGSSKKRAEQAAAENALEKI